MEVKLVSACWDLIHQIQRVNGTYKDQSGIMEKMELLTTVVHKFNVVVKLSGTEIPDVSRLLEHILIECTKLVLSEFYQDMADIDPSKRSFIASIKQIAEDTKMVPPIHRKFSQMFHFVTSKNGYSQSNIISADSSPEKRCPSSLQKNQYNMESSSAEDVIQVSDEENTQVRGESNQQDGGLDHSDNLQPVPVMCFQHVEVPGGSTLVPIWPLGSPVSSEGSQLSPELNVTTWHASAFQNKLSYTTPLTICASSDTTQHLSDSQEDGTRLSQSGLNQVMSPALLTPDSLEPATGTCKFSVLEIPVNDLPCDTNDCAIPVTINKLQASRKRKQSQTPTSELSGSLLVPVSASHDQLSTVYTSSALSQVSSEGLADPILVVDNDSDVDIMGIESEPSSSPSSNQKGNYAQESPTLINKYETDFQLSKMVASSKQCSSAPGGSSSIPTTSKTDKSKKNSAKKVSVTKLSPSGTKTQHTAKRSTASKLKRRVESKQSKSDKKKSPAARSTRRNPPKNEKTSTNLQDSNLSEKVRALAGTQISSRKINESVAFVESTVHKTSRKKPNPRKVSDKTKEPIPPSAMLNRRKSQEGGFTNKSKYLELPKTSIEKSNVVVGSHKTKQMINQKKTNSHAKKNSCQIAQTDKAKIQRSGKEELTISSSVQKGPAKGSGTKNSGQNARSVRKKNIHKEDTTLETDQGPHEETIHCDGETKKESVAFKRLSREDRSHCLQIANILEEIGLETPVISCTLCDAKFFSKSGQIRHLTNKHAGEAWNPYTRRNTIDLRPRRTTSFDSHSSAPSSTVSAGSARNDSSITSSPATLPFIKQELDKCDSSEGSTSDSDDLICTSVDLTSQNDTTVFNSPTAMPFLRKQTSGSDSDEDIICTLVENYSPDASSVSSSSLMMPVLEPIQHKSDSDDDIVCTGVEVSSPKTLSLKKCPLKLRLRNQLSPK